MYSLASLPLAHALMASSSSRINPSDLEDSLLQLVQGTTTPPSKSTNSLKAQNEATKKAVCVAELLVEAVNGGVKELFINEKRIELEIRALTATISCFIKQTDWWLSLTRSINTAIKEIGDFENWMKIMEFDSKSIQCSYPQYSPSIIAQVTASCFNSHGSIFCFSVKYLNHGVT